MKIKSEMLTKFLKNKRNAYTLFAAGGVALTTIVVVPTAVILSKTSSKKEALAFEKLFYDQVNNKYFSNANDFLKDMSMKLVKNGFKNGANKYFDENNLSGIGIKTTSKNELTKIQKPISIDGQRYNYYNDALDNKPLDTPGAFSVAPTQKDAVPTTLNPILFNDKTFFSDKTKLLNAFKDKYQMVTDFDNATKQNGQAVELDGVNYQYWKNAKPVTVAGYYDDDGATIDPNAKFYKVSNQYFTNKGGTSDDEKNTVFSALRALHSDITSDVLKNDFNILKEPVDNLGSVDYYTFPTSVQVDGVTYNWYQTYSANSSGYFVDDDTTSLDTDGFYQSLPLNTQSVYTLDGGKTYVSAETALKTAISHYDSHPNDVWGYGSRFVSEDDILKVDDNQKYKVHIVGSQDYTVRLGWVPGGLATGDSVAESVELIPIDSKNNIEADKDPLIFGGVKAFTNGLSSSFVMNVGGFINDTIYSSLDKLLVHFTDAKKATLSTVDGTKISVDGIQYTYKSSKMEHPLANPGYFASQPNTYSASPINLGEIKFQAGNNAVFHSIDDLIKAYSSEIQPESKISGATVVVDGKTYTYRQPGDVALNHAGYFASKPTLKTAQPLSLAPHYQIKGTNQYFTDDAKLISAMGWKAFQAADFKTMGLFSYDNVDYQWYDTFGTLPLANPGYYAKKPDSLTASTVKPFQLDMLSYVIGTDEYFTTLDNALVGANASHVSLGYVNSQNDYFENLDHFTIYAKDLIVNEPITLDGKVYGIEDVKKIVAKAVKN